MAELRKKQINELTVNQTEKEKAVCTAAEEINPFIRRIFIWLGTMKRCFITSILWG